MRFLCSVVLLVAAGGAVFGQPRASKDPNELSLEVTALQSLHNFNLTAAQLDMIARTLKTDPIVDRKRTEGKASPKLVKALEEVRAAYAKADEKQITDALLAFDKLYETESADLDDAIVISAAARKRTAEFVRQLSPGQVANYFAYYSTQWKGPTERLLDVILAGRKLEGDDWKATRDAAAEDIAWLMAGCDDEAFADAKTRVTQLIERYRKFGDDELAKQRPELDELVRKMTAKLGPIDVLKHAMERDVAALLSNPRLAAAVELRRRANRK